MGRTSHPSLVFFSFSCISSFSCIFSSFSIIFFVSNQKKKIEMILCSTRMYERKDAPQKCFIQQILSVSHSDEQNVIQRLDTIYLKDQVNSSHLMSYIASSSFKKAMKFPCWFYHTKDHLNIKLTFVRSWLTMLS